MSKTIQSNVFEIKRGLENVDSTFSHLNKKYEETETTLNAYANKTNVGIFKDLANIVGGFKENQIQQIRSLNNKALDAAIESHKKMDSVASSLNV